MQILIRVFGMAYMMFILISCENKPLVNANLADGEYKLYFIIPPGNQTMRKTIDFHEKYGSFYISNPNKLEILQKEIIQNKTSGRTSSNSYYFLRLTNDKKFVDGGVIDLENHEFLYHNGKYDFDVDELEKLHEDFIPLNSFQVDCRTITNSNKFFEFMLESSGFIYNIGNDKNPLAKFKGKVGLKTGAQGIDFSGGIENIQNKFRKDFENLGEILFLETSYQGGDSISLSMLWQEDFSNRLPDGYRIIKPFSDTINLPIFVYDIDKTEIRNFFENERIKDFIIRDLN